MFIHVCGPYDWSKCFKCYHLQFSGNPASTLQLKGVFLLFLHNYTFNHPTNCWAVFYIQLTISPSHIHCKLQTSDITDWAYIHSFATQSAGDWCNWQRSLVTMTAHPGGWGCITYLVDFPDPSELLPAREVASESGQRTLHVVLNHLHHADDGGRGGDVREETEHKHLVLPGDLLRGRLHAWAIHPPHEHLGSDITEVIIIIIIIIIILFFYSANSRMAVRCAVQDI